MASRKQHPRITITNSPEQGEVSGEEDYTKEKDAQMKRQREEAQQSKNKESRTVSTRYPKSVAVQADSIKESRMKKLDPKRDDEPVQPSRHSAESSRAKRPSDAETSTGKADSPTSKRTKPLRKIEPDHRESKHHHHETAAGTDLTSERGVTTKRHSPKRDHHHKDYSSSSHGQSSGRDREKTATDSRKSETAATTREHSQSADRHSKRTNTPQVEHVSSDAAKRRPDSRHTSTDTSRGRNREIPRSPVSSPLKLAEPVRPTLSRRSSQAEIQPVSSQAKISPEKPKSSKKLTRSGSPLSDSDEEASVVSHGSAVTKSTGSEDETVYGPMRSRFESESAGTYGLAEVEPDSPSPDPEDVVMEEDVPDDSGLPPYFPGIDGCRSVDEFECINRIEEGTYGVVYRARDKRTNEVVALKRLKMEKEKEGFPITSLREVSTLLKAHHPNVVAIKEVVVGHNMDKIYMVMEFVEHDLKGLMETMRQPFSIGEVKTLMRQLLNAVKHLHDNWIVHRDLKTSNLLLNHRGILKVADFGLAREYGSPLRPYTPVVVTLWYRSPELLLGIKEYSTPIDVWSCGCIFGEFLTLKPLFPGKSELEQITKIFKELGNPSEANWPGYSELPLVKNTSFVEYPYNVLRKRFPPTVLTNSGYDLMSKLLEYNPKTRISAEEALKHSHFRDMPLPVDPSMFPTWPARSEQGPRGPRQNTPKPPSGGKMYKETADADGLDGFRIGGQKESANLKGEGFRLKF